MSNSKFDYRQLGKRPAAEQHQHTTAEQLEEAVQTVQEVTQAGIQLAKQIKPSNRNMIGLIGLAGLAYWLFTSDSK